ncbi:IS200/IS605 family transposase [Rhodococcus opacus]|uniref:IS200/IS605 family transposase n=1 Tax=Rhodococcus opacus TaxID=37919 RepID=UPI002952E79E|nr:IS200/IS605 family transposase [Rhodococcus opacus]MDV7087289.1 IS200/IS605 family transposase [Rhodococcus opacus]
MVSEPEYRRGRSVVSALHVHLVFVTKYRRGVLTDEMLTTCEQVMRSVCDDYGSRLVEFNGEGDNVHLLIEYPPTIQISKLVNSLKGVSARRLRDQYREWVNRHSMNGHLWSPSYFAASCGGAPISIIRQYIEQQRRPPRAPGRPKSMR